MRVLNLSILFDSGLSVDDMYGTEREVGKLKFWRGKATSLDINGCPDTE